MALSRGRFWHGARSDAIHHGLLRPAAAGGEQQRGEAEQSGADWLGDGDRQKGVSVSVGGCTDTEDARREEMFGFHGSEG